MSANHFNTGVLDSSHYANAFRAGTLVEVEQKSERLPRRVALERRSQALEQANEALRRANAELEQFSSAAAHDLQEPLRMVTTYSQLLKTKYSGQLDADADEFIEYCVDGAARMGKLVRDLLAYAHSIAQIEEPRCSVDLNRVLARVESNLHLAISESKASIGRADLPPVLAHETLMEQLFQNLISNAIKYRENGTAPVVTISAVRREREWLFSVKDNGIGIPADSIDKVFTGFRRLHAASKYPGTGLGLSICQRIVKRYGGEIWVESASGAGSAFFFTFPA